MINNINNRTNDNFLIDYINYHFMKEKKKFTKLKYNLTFNNSKKAYKIDAYNTIESKNNKPFPYLNYNSPLDYKSRNKIPKNFLSCIKRKSKNFEIFNNKLSPKKKSINIFKNPQEKEINNSFFHSQRENSTINEKIDKSRIKKMLSKDKIDFIISNKKASKNLKTELDKELIIDDKTKTIVNDAKNLKKIRRENREKKDKEEEKIIDILYIGNKLINNCKIKNKIIYDIRPLNKTKEKASCHFDSEENKKSIPALINEIKNKENNLKNLESTNYKIKFFRNSNSQIYSTNSYINSDIFKFYSNEEIKNNNKINASKEKTIKYEFSEQELMIIKILIQTKTI